ncbi:MAG: threonine synthase [SAR202 cluster bacterium]|nr:threonine synthase [SAR202 cluster bacterium]
MSHYHLACNKCALEHPPSMETLACISCGAPLDVRYVASAEIGGTGRIPAMPFHTESPSMTLGEGDTPVVPLEAVGRSLGLYNPMAKLEYLNPTGSFKDRGTAAMMSVAKEFGIEAIAEDSSGNAGASVAAYAAKAGIEAHIFAPASAPQAKMQQIGVYGAHTHAIDGPREAATDAAMAYCREQGLVYASHNLSPFFLEGTKTFAYEVARQMGDALPDHIVVPVGNGSLFIGAWKGFQELIAAGALDRAPKMHAIQAEAVMPIAAAFAGRGWTPRAGTATIAGGIAVGAPPRKRQVLDVLQASGGVSVAVSEPSIESWHATMAQSEGIYCEPTSAAAFAGLELLLGAGHVAPNDRVLVAVTGFGLKDAPPTSSG